MHSADRPATRLATRLAFFVAGFGIACWAPLVPLAKQRLAVDDGVLGGLLLCLGVGSIIAMAMSGPLAARAGTKPIIIAGGLGLAILLPVVTLADTPAMLGSALFAFGVALGMIDVGVNVHAIEVERDSPVPLMSGFHAFFSIGGFAGAMLMTLALSLRLTPLAATIICGAVMLIATVAAWPRLLRRAPDATDGPLFALPRGVVVLLAALAAITFLVEGAMLDWSALFLTGAGLVAEVQGGIGYVCFAVAMTLGRLAGDRIAARIGDRVVLAGGGAVVVAGFAVLLSAPVAALAMAGFFLIGLGASNIVPVFYRQVGAQDAMPVGLAAAAVTTTGYAGILVGPAAIGFVAQQVGLSTAFWMMAALFCIVPLCTRLVVRRRG